MKGTIARVNDERQFGFIKGEDNVDYFFHRSAITNGSFEDATKGRAVEFVPGEGEKGPRTEEVTL
jgi:CspA family cold shock protein